MSFDIAKIVGFEWDLNNLEHIKEHDVDYKECEEVFTNLPLVILDDEQHSKLEERFSVFGVNSSGRKMALAITVRNNKIRVIMARDQSRKERRVLEDTNIKLGGVKK